MKQDYMSRSNEVFRDMASRTWIGYNIQKHLETQEEAIKYYSVAQFVYSLILKKTSSSDDCDSKN